MFNSLSPSLQYINPLWSDYCNLWSPPLEKLKKQHNRCHSKAMSVSIVTTLRNLSLDMFPQTNRVEAAVPPSTPDRPVSAARRKIHYTGCFIKRGSLHPAQKLPGWRNPLDFTGFSALSLNYLSVVLPSRYRSRECNWYTYSSSGRGNGSGNISTFYRFAGNISLNKFIYLHSD